MQTIYAKCIAMTEPLGRFSLVLIAFFQELERSSFNVSRTYTNLKEALEREPSDHFSGITEAVKSPFIWASYFGVFDAFIFSSAATTSSTSDATMLARVAHDGLLLRFLGPSYQDNREFALAALR